MLPYPWRQRLVLHSPVNRTPIHFQNNRSQQAHTSIVNDPLPKKAAAPAYQPVAHLKK